MRVTEIYCIKPFHVLIFFPSIRMWQNNCLRFTANVPNSVPFTSISCTLLTSCSKIFTGYSIMCSITVWKKGMYRDLEEHIENYLILQFFGRQTISWLPLFSACFIVTLFGCQWCALLWKFCLWKEESKERANRCENHHHNTLQTHIYSHTKSLPTNSVFIVFAGDIFV